MDGYTTKQTTLTKHRQRQNTTRAKYTLSTQLAQYTTQIQNSSATQHGLGHNSSSQPGQVTTQDTIKAKHSQDATCKYTTQVHNPGRYTSRARNTTQVQISQVHNAIPTSPGHNSIHKRAKCATHDTRTRVKYTSPVQLAPSTQLNRTTCQTEVHNLDQIRKVHN